MRLFVSVDLPDVADAVADLQAEFGDADGLRFTDPAQTHVTLKFLGGVDTDRLDTVEAALDRAVDDADVDPFDVEVRGLGAFPSEDYITVVWVGVTPTGDPVLKRLHDHIEAEYTALGFDPEDHSFTPHATIARMDHAGGKELVQSKLRALDPTLGTHHVDTVTLTESTLTDDGPVYDTRYAVALGN